jgi:aspartyl-tRNA(Asn)/glutamyl-tRNA(Gln) amidotransferase subunit A
MTDEIAFLPAARLLALYRDRKLSPVEVMTETLRRLERYEGALNAFVLYDAEAAMAQARASEARWQRGEPQGLLDGVPVAIKDTLLTMGWPRLVGSRTIDPNQAWNEDSPVTAKLRAHGAVLFGKTTTPEFGWKPLTDSPLSGVTRNPWDLERSPGGSSGGSAAAGAGRHLSARGRHRCRRLDPHPGSVLRDLWLKADVRPGCGLPAFGIRRCRPYRANDAHR